LAKRGELEGCESMMGTVQGASSPIVYEIPFTTPALGALFCNDTVLVEDISADSYLKLFVRSCRRGVRRDVAVFRAAAQ